MFQKYRRTVIVHEVLTQNYLGWIHTDLQHDYHWKQNNRYYRHYNSKIGWWLHECKRERIFFLYDKHNFNHILYDIKCCRACDSASCFIFKSPLISEIWMLQIWHNLQRPCVSMLISRLSQWEQQRLLSSGMWTISNQWGGSTFLQKTSKLQPDYMVLHFRWQDYF